MSASGSAQVRRILVAGNWKMNLDRESAQAYYQRLRTQATDTKGTEVVLFPPFSLIPLASEVLQETPVAWGGQDLHPDDDGAHTGDVSALHLLDWGATWVLCGHSERRRDHLEKDDLVARKVAAAQSHGLVPILCVGETQEEHDRGDTESVLERQLEAAVPQGKAPWTLAYEPVWAIGTGATATPELAQRAHAFLRRTVSSLADAEVAAGLRIVYGGSVKPTNCEALLQEADIDGFLIGGASLDPDSFLDIMRRCGSFV